LLDVVQLPGVLGKVSGPPTGLPGYGPVSGGCHPAVVVDAAVAEHLEILSPPPGGGPGVVKGVGHAHALDRLLPDAVDLRRLSHTRRLKDGRHDVDDMVELGAQPAPVRDAARPVDDHWVARATEVACDLLGPLEGSGPGPGPADRDVRLGTGSADLVEAF